jgi:hypothetical protein
VAATTAPRPKRASRTAIRAWAWAAGAASFLAPYGLLGLWPRPAEAAATAPPAVAAPRRPVVVIVTKKIVYTRSAAPSVTSSGPVSYTYAPATAPATAATCGTHPC